MSRSTKALKRFGVPGLAAVTMVAGLPLFLGTASAAHIQSLTLSPDSSTDNAGICVPYTVQLNFTTPEQAVAETVDVTLTESSTASSVTDVDFCTAPTGTQQPSAPTDQVDSGGAGTEDRAEFRTNSAGAVTFGVTSNNAGTIQVRAFYETTDNDVFNAGEFQDVSTQTFVGTSEGTNATQDRADFVEVVDRTPLEPTPATATVTADADTDLAIETETRTYRVYVGTNSTGTSGVDGVQGGGRLAGVIVSFTVDSGVNSADRAVAVFGTTDNNGIATGTITFPARTEPTGTTETTDNVVFFVNQSGTLSTPGADDITTGNREPRDTLTVTVRQDAQQINRTVTLTPLPDTTPTAFHTTTGDAAVNPANDGNRPFRAIVDAADGQPTTDTTELAFGVAGGSGDETVTPFECSTDDTFTNSASSTTAADTNDSFCDVVVNDPTPTVGQTLTVTVTVRGTSAADTATLTFRNRPQDARLVVLTPESVTVDTNTAQQLQAKVTDVDGNPVPGVEVRFTETGAGAFRNGNSFSDGLTDANGIATAEVISLPGETGTMTVTASISAASTGNPSDCDEAAGAGTDPQGVSLSDTSNPGTEAAGDCDDTATVTFRQGGASPTTSATPTSTTSPTGTPTSGPPAVPCAGAESISLDRTTIIATGSAQITVRGTANSVVDVFAYSRPSTTYRVVRSFELGADGTASDRVVPPTNTRLYAQQRGCDASPSIVLNVRTQISLNVVRNGVRNYTFSGRLLPARPNGLIASLYRVTNDGRQILTAQTRANAAPGQAGYDANRPAGSYTIVRQFTGSGRFGFVVRTGQDLQNAPGSSNVRSLAVF